MTRAAGLTLVRASAGSGKTHRLTTEVTSAVRPGAADSVDVEGLVAVTYTTRAAGELTARIRRTLIEAGAPDRAQRLPLAHVGTVHAVCLRLVQELALDAGLSPRTDVLPGAEARLLAEALDQGLDPGFRARIQALADRLELRWDAKRRRTDWLTPVRDVMTLARSNRIAAGALGEMAERSASRLLALLGPAEADGDALDRALERALDAALAALDAIDDTQKNTQAARDEVRRARAKAKRGELRYGDWVKLQKLSPGKSALAAVAPLVRVAARIDRHPRLHDDVRELTRAVFEAARQGLVAYDAWKKRRRVVDFVDMIDRALVLVECPEVARELRGRLELLVVDELQDTSPVQLALFVRLHALAGRSTWVGDPKQCIFEYAGADPTLMEAVSEWARREGGVLETLPTNRRSRPELVDACSTLFAAAFEPHGVAKEDVVVAAARAAHPALDALPPLGLFWLEGSKQEHDAEAIAEGIRRMLAEPGETPVVDRATGQSRDVRAGDVAVLVATNAEAERVATALARRGVRAALARAGLFGTPEGTLATAALRALVDARDTLALATLDALTGFGGKDPDTWLAERIAAESARRAARDEARARGESASAVHSDPLATFPGLAALAGEVDALAPSEALDRVLAALDATAIASRWPDPAQRLANLDALRALASAYEERCASRREAATLGGLVAYFDEAAEVVLERDEERASDEQHVGAGDHAVTIVTYHRAKGLEWPVVVLASLDREARRDAFEVAPETTRAAFDASDPLGGRWIRYWPWPYGMQKKTALAERAAASDEGRAVSLRERRERVRLLYVGFTRARDHLVLAVRRKKNGALASTWLDALADRDGAPLLALPGDVAPDERAHVVIRGLDGALRVRARHWALDVGSDPPARMPEERSHAWFARPAVVNGPAPPYGIAPSRAASDWPELAVARVGEAIRIGERLPLGRAKGIDWDVVGNATHAFLAADIEGLARDERLARAERILDASGLFALLAPDALVTASDTLRAWVEARWPKAIWHRELPVSGTIATPHGARRIDGVLDLLLETEDGVVIVDHKSYPGAESTWRAKAEEFAPQLSAYAEVLRMAGARVLEAWVSFAIGGGVVRVEV